MHALAINVRTIVRKRLIFIFTSVSNEFYDEPSSIGWRQAEHEIADIYVRGWHGAAR